MGAPLTCATASRFRVLEAQTEDQRSGARALRARCFGNDDLRQADRFDSAARHYIVEDLRDGAILCSFRLTTHEGGSVAQGYAGQVYDLTALRDFPDPMLELGRFCLDPERQHPDVPRLAWGRLAREVDATGAGLLFGCASFAGTNAAPYSDAFGLLQARHLAPERWRPGVQAAETLSLREVGQAVPDLRHAQHCLPPLLRSYLAMGGWVSDHAVVDRDLGTMHVFTGLEIAAIPPARQRLLRALA